VVVFLLSQLIGLKRFLRSSIDFALIEMELACVHQYRPRSAVVLMMSVDLTGAMKLIERIAAELDISRVSSPASFAFA
jgi:hypothetical protein